MSSVNKVILIGRLGRDPEVRQTGAGQSVANFTLATDESYKDRDGNKQKKTEWHNLVVWGKMAEAFVGPYLKKGMLVYVEGKLQSRKWQDREGKERYITEINVQNINSLESKSDSSSGSSRTAPRSNEPVDDESIPF